MINLTLASGELHYLAGFESNSQDGNSDKFNWILSNGVRSAQRDKCTYYTHMMPAGSHNRIRSIKIYHSYCVDGFSFFDKDKKLLWRIGSTDPYLKVETVLIFENEVIADVAAKLY